MSAMSSFVSTTAELAAYPANRAKLQALLPEHVSPWFLDSLLAQRPLITVNEACQEILLEARRREQATRIASTINKSRKV